MSTDTNEQLDTTQPLDDNLSNKPGLPWLRRTFGKMEEGGLRGNIFLMTISTVGCAFFYLPYYAKQVGIMMVIMLLAIPAFLSYYSSYKLYYGFKQTKAKTYDECMKSILGPTLGYLSNVTIFMHTFSAVVGAWIFSYKVLSNTLESLIDTKGALETQGFKIFYFTTVMLCLFISSISGKIDKLKFISMFGIAIIIYMITVFGFQVSDYYHYYNELEPEGIVIENFKLNAQFVEAYGICFFMYLNQYTIIPICNNIKQVTSKRISKVISRTILFAFILFITVLFVGYFSLPNYDMIKAISIDKLFVLRPAIKGTNDNLIIGGKLLFAIYLIIGMLVKGHFFLIYFNQLLANTISIIKGGKVKLVEADDIEEVTPEEKRVWSTRPSRIHQDEVEDHKVEVLIDPIEETDSHMERIDRTKVSEERTLKSHAINLTFLSSTMILTVVLESRLNTFLSIAGGFIAIFEIIVFPLLMILAIDAKKKIMGPIEKPVTLVLSSVFIVMGLSCAFLTLYKTVSGSN